MAMSELERFEERIVAREGPPDAEQTQEDPEFIIVGTRRPGGGVILFVSDQVINAKFARRIDGYDDVPVGPGEHAPVAHVPRIHAIVGVELTSFEQVLADSYLGALQSVVEEQQRRRRAALNCSCGYPEHHGQQKP